MKFKRSICFGKRLKKKLKGLKTDVKIGYVKINFGYKSRIVDFGLKQTNIKFDRKMHKITDLNKNKEKNLCLIFDQKCKTKKN